MHVRKKTMVSCAALVAAVVTGVGAAALPAGAAPATRLTIEKTLPGDYVGPLQFAIGNNTSYVADSFVGALFETGNSTPIATGPIDGVAVNRSTGDLAYTSTDGDTGVALLHIRHGSTTRTVDIGAYERANNPDHRIRYGVVGTVSDCVRQALKQARIPVQYNGLVDSHPYSVASFANDSWLIADAAGNDILQVDSSGNIELLAVLPAVPVTITQDFASENNLPGCVVGTTYRFESVPTDVEVGPNNLLYVSTLPGGEVPLQGKVYSIAPRTHTVTKIADGFNLGVNLAVDSAGDVFAAELATGNVQLLRNGAVTTVINLPGLVGLEFAHGHLYASTAPAVLGGSEPGHVYRLVQAG